VFDEFREDFRAHIHNPAFRERIGPRLKQLVEKQRQDIACSGGVVESVAEFLGTGGLVSLDHGMGNSRKRIKPAIERGSERGKASSRSENAPAVHPLKPVKKKGASRQTLQEQLR